MPLCTEFSIYKDATFPDDVIVAVYDGKVLKCWYTNNNEAQILSSVERLLANPKSGWSATQTDLSKHITTYTIHSHPEYFL